MGACGRASSAWRGMEGLYAPNMNLIILDSRLTDVQRRCTLCHELIHAKWDDAGCMGGGKAEIRARRLTAEALIDEDGVPSGRSSLRRRRIRDGMRAERDHASFMRLPESMPQQEISSGGIGNDTIAR